MAKKDDGGPAFPEGVSADALGGLNFSRCEGMSIRDYFAASVVNHLHFDVADRLVAPDGPEQDDINDDNVYVVPGSELARRIAAAAYLIADAMLAERLK